MNKRVIVDIDTNGIAIVTLNRADKMNALDFAMFEEIYAAGKSLQTNRDVRAIILHGDGKAFCSGLDLDALSANDFKRAALGSKDIGKAPNFYQQVAWIWKQVPAPVIAALHGYCLGGGLQIALGADMRYAHPDTKISVMERKWGMIPDMSGTQTLRDLVRLDIAKELTFTGRIISGNEAANLGLVTAVADKPLEKALQISEDIVNASPDTAVYTKQLFEQTWHGDSEYGLLLEETLQAQLLGSYNQMEAVFSGMQKRQGKFENRMQAGFYEGSVFKKK